MTTTRDQRDAIKAALDDLPGQELYDLDTRAAAYYTGKADARRRRVRRWCPDDPHWIGRAYTRGYDEVLAQRSAT